MLLACLVLGINSKNVSSILNEDFELKANILKGKCSIQLSSLINKLVRRKCTERFQSATKALQTLSSIKYISQEKCLNYSNLVPGKLLVNAPRRFLEVIDPIEKKAVRYHAFVHSNKSVNKVWAVEFIKLNQYFSQVALSFCRAISTDENIDWEIGVTKIYREYDYESQLNEFINCSRQTLQQFNLDLQTKLIDQNIEDIDWFVNKAMILNCIDGYILIRLYSNPSLKPTKPIHILIDSNLNRPFWTVPTKINTVKNAIDWRSFEEKSIYKKFVNFFNF